MKAKKNPGLSIDEVEAAGGYSVIYADPPWQYTQGGRGAARNHYDEMTLEDIRALPVERIAAPTSVLFMWGTWPKLLEVLPTITAWGFTYKTIGFVWVKTNPLSGTAFWGGGYWTRANTEYCLIGVRGRGSKAPRRDASDAARRVHQIVQGDLDDLGPPTLHAPRGEHSRKPAEVRDRIVALCGDVPRVELFARERAAGWDAFGDDAALGGSDVRLLTT